MRWQNKDGSTNIEDRRGRSPGGLALRGPVGIIVVLVVLVAGAYGIDLSPLLGGNGFEIGQGQTQNYTPPVEEQSMAAFSSVALKTTEDTWEDIFQTQGRVYTPPKLVLYTGLTSTTCGNGSAAMGPFYCPADQTVYLDLSFFGDMKSQLGGGGDFAQGYVIAHEIGHHVQHLLGIDQNVRKLQQSTTSVEANRLSVMLELQADCFAGVWGHAMQREGILEPGDLESALRTAEAIGDDRLQKRSSGRVVPDSFTHGTSKQRYTWFNRGFESGNPDMCNTFKELR